MNLRNVSSLCNGAYIFFVFIALFGLGSPFTEAQVKAYVSAPYNNDIVVIDAKTNTVTKYITAGPGPYSIEITPDGTRAYVAITASDYVSVIDTETDDVLETIQTIYPGVLAVTPDGSHVYVPNFDGWHLEVIDTSTNTIVNTINTGYDRHFGSAITPDGSYLYTASVFHNIVSVIDTSTNTIIDTLTQADGIGDIPCLLAITPNGNYVYVSNRGSGTVSVIAISTNTVVNTILISGLPATPYIGEYPDITINEDGTRAYVSDQVNNCLAVIDTSSNEVIASVPVGSSPAGVAITPDGTQVWVANVATDNISVIDTSTYQVINTIDLKAANGRFGWPLMIAFVDPNPTISVTIDIKPGSDPNSINLGSNGNVPVAILSTSDFDATSNVNPESITLAGATVKLKGKGTPMYSFDDVNNDGLIDLIVHVDTEAFTLNPTDTIAVLEGETFDGRNIRGEDTVRIVQY